MIRIKVKTKPKPPYVPCDCGHWPHDFLDPCCAFLKWCSAMTEAGWCNNCGKRLSKAIGWDERMGCVVRQVECPKHCQRGLSWVYAEDVTDDELKLLGLERQSPTRAGQLRCEICRRPYVNTVACCGNPNRKRSEPNRDPEE